MTALSEVEISVLPSVGKDSATVQATRLISPYDQRKDKEAEGSRDPRMYPVKMQDSATSVKFLGNPMVRFLLQSNRHIGASCIP